MHSAGMGSEFFRPSGAVKKSCSLTEDSICLILSQLDSARALSVWILFSSGEHDQILDLPCRPEDYSDARSFRDAYLATQLLRKADFLRLSIDAELVSYRKFMANEWRNTITNRRFANLASDPQFKGQNVWLLNAAARKIQEVLSPFGDAEVEEWFIACRWGPGSNTEVRGADVTASNKFQRTAGVTSRLVQVLSTLPDHSPLWDIHLNSLGGYDPQDVEELTLVPKDAKSRRSICIPVGINSYYQLGLGKMLRRRIYRHLGIDLDSQLRNQLSAAYGAYRGNLSTVDFSSASDSICYQVVRELIPADWFYYLEACRVPACRPSESLQKTLLHFPRSCSTHYYELFTAMGCGFTFELETLIFAAAAYACCEYVGVDSSLVTVYGDDVVIPTEALDVFREFTTFLGFTFNPEKSFSTGSFRESCGSHFLGRVDVKPFYIRRKLRHVSDVYVLCNNIRRWSHRNMYYGCDPRLFIAWKYLIRKTPQRFRFFIPEGYGDGGFVSEFDEACPSTRKRARFGIEGFKVKSMTSEPLTVFHDDIGRLLDGLHRLDTDKDVVPAGNRPSVGNNPFGRPVRARYRVTWIKYVQEWSGLGPWLFE